jgi:hypothetical protein
MGVVLRADPLARDSMARRSFVRAACSLAMTTTRGRTRQSATPSEFIRSNWRDDDAAPLILRAASNPLETSSFAQVQAYKVLPMLAPDAASSKLLNMGAKLSLDGISSIALPYVGGSGRPVQPAFVAEGQPAPVVDLSTSGAILGPTCKVLVQAAITGELQSASAETAEAVLGQALAISTAQSLGAALFSANAAVPGVSPAGILHGAVPIASAGGNGAPGVADNLGLLLQSISNSGINIDDAVFIATASLATKLRVLAGPHFADAILSSAQLPAGMVIAVIPGGLASGYQGKVDLESSIAAAVHMETAPLANVDGSGALAVPTRSAFSTYSIVIKVRARMCWVCQPNAVAVLSGADW